MDNVRSLFTNRRNLISLIILLILIIAIPLGIYLVKRQQQFRSKATADPIIFNEGGCVKVINGQKVATCPTVSVTITAPQ